jgi:SAM-dependent methyltransferase
MERRVALIDRLKARVRGQAIKMHPDPADDPPASAAAAPEPLPPGPPAPDPAAEQPAALASRMDRLEKEAGQLPALLSRLADLEAAVGQMHTALRRETGILPLPPRKLQIRVVGSYNPRFYESAFSICDDLDAVLSGAGRSLKDFRRILDWGCGCGRMTRAFRTRLPSSERYATDIDPEAIDWLKQNYGQVADFRLAPHHPPTSYADGLFDFVLGLSIFTHLPEDMQFEWLGELERITSPGGYLILTTSGANNIDPATRGILEEKGFFYSDVFNYGRSIGLPDFYQNTFHTPAYIRREWSRFFEVVDILPARVEAHQDAVLLRRRA